MAEQAWTLGGLLDWTAKHLAQKGSESPRLDAEVLLAHVVGCKRIDLYGLRHGEDASPDVRARYKDLIKKRVEGCPVAYLVGKKEFYGMPFAVSPAVLIPRPDTEHLVSEALAEAKKLASPRIVDVGAGSGAVAVTLAKLLPAADVTAVDISPSALAIAKANSASFAEGRVRFLEGDLLAPVAGEEFDLVVSNPPYIPTEDIPKLPVGVRDYEPKVALDGGPGGYAVIQRLAAQAHPRLKPGGFLIVEIGSPQEANVRRILSEAYQVAPTVFDHSGHPRVIKAKR